MLTKLAEWLIRFRIPVILLYLAVSAVLLFYSLQIGFKFSFKQFFPPDHPDVIKYFEAVEDFGTDDNSLLVAFEGEDIFTAPQMTRLKAFHEAAGEVSGVIEVDSLINAARPRWENDTLYIDELFEEIPENAKDFEDKKHYLMESELYNGSYISQDGRAVLFIIKIDPELNTSDGRAPILQDVKSLVAQLRKETGLKITIGGVPFSRSSYADIMTLDTTVMTSMAALVTMLILLITFRHWAGVVLSMMLVLLAMLASVGTMAMADVKISLMSTLTPVVVMITGVANSVHYHTRFYEELIRGRSRRDAILLATEHLGVACFITSFTTAVGFSVLITTDIGILREFGLFTAIGVMSSYFITITLFPAVLSMLPRPSEKRLKRYFAGGSKVVLNFVETMTTRHRAVSLFVCFVLVAVGTAFATQVERKQRLLEDLDENHPIIQTQTYLEKKMGGVMPFEVLIETGEKDGIKEPEVMRFAEKTKAYLETFPKIHKVYAGSDLIKELSQTMNGSDPAFYKIPETRSAIAQYMLLYAMGGKDPMEGLVSPLSDKTRVSARIEDVYSPEANAIYGKIKEWIEKNRPKNLKVTLTGMNPVAHMINNLVVDEIFYTFLLAFAVITVLLVIQFRSLWVGLVSLLPNILPLTIILGMIGALGINLKPSSAITFSIAFGIAVDDTVHFITRYLSEHLQGHRGKEAIHRAIQGTGKAMIYTSVVLICGFAVPIFTSDVEGNVAFGLLSVGAIFTALVADLFLLPVVLPWIMRTYKTREPAP